MRNATLDLTIPAAPLPAVLAEIERQTGHRYEARGEVAREVLSLRVRAVKVEELLPRIAEVVGGEWRTSGDSTILVASPAFERQEKEAENAEKRKNITLALKNYWQDLNKQPVFDDAAAKALLRKLSGAVTEEARSDGSTKYADVFAGQSGTPEHRLLIELLSLIPVEELIDLPDGARIVLSDAPNRMQRALPAGSRDVIERFVRHQRTWRNAIVGSGRSNDTIPVPDVLDGGKLDLVIQDWESGTGFSAQLLVMSSTGQVACNAWARLFGTFDFPEQEKPSAFSADSVKPLDEGDEAQELRRLVVRDVRHDTDDESSRQPILARWQDRMSDPARFEPLGFVPGRLWMRLAENLGDNLVANVSEYSFSPYIESKDRPTPKQVVSELNSLYQTQRSKGWLTIRPQYILQMRADRIDRTAAGNLIRHSLAAGGLLIEDAADYMAQSDTHNALLTWDGGYLTAFLRGTGPNSTIRTMGARDGMRLYGLLTPQQRRLLRERPLPLSSLPPAARAHLERLVYWDSWLSDSGDREPTELLPNGIPGNGLLRLIDDRRETLVQPYTESGRIVLRNLSPRTAARLGQAMGQATTAAEANGWNRFRIRIGHTLKFRVDFTPTVSQEFELYELLDPRVAPVKYDQLPADFRAAADEARKAAQQNTASRPVALPPPSP